LPTVPTARRRALKKGARKRKSPGAFGVGRQNSETAREEKRGLNAEFAERRGGAEKGRWSTVLWVELTKGGCCPRSLHARPGAPKTGA